jgi:CheY-like chemotaxis protein
MHNLLHDNDIFNRRFLFEKNILIVEDVRRCYLYYERTLRGKGFNLINASTVQEADAIYAEYRGRKSIQAIVLDCHLKNSDTLELTKRLRRDFKGYMIGASLCAPSSWVNAGFDFHVDKDDVPKFLCELFGLQPPMPNRLTW